MIRLGRIYLAGLLVSTTIFPIQLREERKKNSYREREGKSPSLFSIAQFTLFNLTLLQTFNIFIFASAGKNVKVLN